MHLHFAKCFFWHCIYIALLKGLGDTGSGVDPSLGLLTAQRARRLESKTPEAPSTETEGGTRVTALLHAPLESQSRVHRLYDVTLYRYMIYVHICVQYCFVYVHMPYTHIYYIYMYNRINKYIYIYTQNILHSLFACRRAPSDSRLVFEEVVGAVTCRRVQTYIYIYIYYICI